MKHQLIKMSALALALGLSAGVYAAGDGQASATDSIASFDVKIGVDPERKVRIWGLSNMVMNASAGTIPATYTPWGALRGVSDTFCVGDTTSGSVTLSVSGTPLANASNESLQASDTTDPTKKLVFHMVVLPTSKTQAGAADVVTKGTYESFTIAGADTGKFADLAAACTPGNGNVRKSMVLQSGAAAPTAGFYTGTLTLTAKPI